VWAPGAPVSHLTYLGLYALQHRGQESAGIAIADGDKIWVDKDMGLVATTFTPQRLAPLTGASAIGHTRYSTSGSSSWDHAHPVYRDIPENPGSQFAIAHNGNLTNTAELAADLGYAGNQDNDSGVIAEMISFELATPDADLVTAVNAVTPRLEGAFSLVLLGENRVIGVRDPHGFRPLVLGQLNGGGYVLASETPALDTVGASLLREVDPGEIVVIDSDGVTTYTMTPAPQQEPPSPKLCSFEFVYFARPDGQLDGIGVHGARRRMGMRLAKEAPAPSDADLVMPIPASSIPGAQGFAEESGIPYRDGLIKNAYIGRTFMAPTQELREQAVRIKLNPIRENIAGNRLVVVEDSIVRATTLRATLRMLRDAGALEIHLRVLSPPYRWPCFMGLDTGDQDTLIAAGRTVDGIRELLDVDSLHYISPDGMLAAIGGDPDNYCTACVSGEYPIALPDRLRNAIRNPVP
jgi:amidophosphoribosyltransferase